MRHASSSLIVLVLAGANAAGRDVLPVGTFQGLGDLSGGGFLSRAFALSEDGSTVVGTSSSALGGEAFRWRNGVMSPLGDLPGSNVYSEARAVSADGNVVFGFGSTDLNDRVFRWENGVMATVPEIPPASRIDWVDIGCSADGTTIVGRSLESSPSSHYEAYRHVGGVRYLVGMPQVYYTDATGTSANGSVTVGTSISQSGYRAYKWENGIASVLSNLPTGGTHGIDVSASGNVIVGALDDGQTLQGLCWENGQVTLLGPVPGTNLSWPLAISADGATIVGTDGPIFHNFAFVWDAQNGVRRVDQVLHDVFGVNLNGWSLADAIDVSADGRTIIGNGYDPSGREQCWIAVIPSPGSPGILMASLGSLGLRSRRRPATR